MADDAADDLATALEELEQEQQRNQELEQRILELEDAAYGEAGAGETQQFLDEIKQLEEANEQLQEQLDAQANLPGAADQVQQLQQQFDDLQEENTAKDVAMVKMTNDIKNLQTNCDTLQTKLHQEVEKARKKSRADGTSRKDAKSHRRELNRVLEENRELRSDIVDLESDRDKLIGAVEQLHDEVQESRKKLSTLEEEKDDAVKREQIKDEQIKALRHELEETQDERHVLEKIQGDHEAFVEQLKQRHDQSTADTRRRLDHETREVARLQQENERLRDNTQVGALQIRLNKAETQVTNAHGEVQVLKQQLDLAADELRKVVEEYIMLEDDFNAKVEEKVLDERRVITTLQERMEGQKNATEQARDDLMKMADDKADIERQLADREHQCKLYEKKHGLEEAVAHQKELKLEIRRRDRELSKINHKLSEQLEANDLLTATLRKLKIDYNLPPDFEYPKLELREEIRSEKERLRADNIMWEQQNAELEAERTRLLQALRTQAQLSSVKGFKQFGLNAEQILQLNYFATQLKKGVAAHDIVSGSHGGGGGGGGGGGSAAKSNARTQQVERENEQLKEQLRRIEIKLEMYQEGQPIVMASSLAQPSSPATGNSSSSNNSNSSNNNNNNSNPGPSQEVSLLTNEISSLRRENERLKTELPKIIQESMDEFRGTLASQAAALNNSGGGTLTIAPPRSPR